MLNAVGMLAGSQTGIFLLHVFLQQVGDEVLGGVRYFIKGLVLKVPGGRGDVGQRLIVVVAHERRQTAQPERTTNEAKLRWAKLKEANIM